MRHEKGSGTRPVSLTKSGEYGSSSVTAWRHRMEDTMEKEEKKRGDPISHWRPRLLEDRRDFFGHRTLTHRPVSSSIAGPRRRIARGDRRERPARRRERNRDETSASGRFPH